MDYKQIKSLDKSRGHFFYNVIDKPLSEKYNLEPLIINYIRKEAIYRKKSRQDICVAITNALQIGSYLTSNSKPNGYNNIQEMVSARTKTLEFLLRCKQEDFDEITQLTKWDYDYEGEDKKYPSREEARKIRSQKPEDYENL